MPSARSDTSAGQAKGHSEPGVIAHFIARLRADLARIVGPEQLEQGRFGLAVSGGPDSMAMLALFHQTTPDRIAVASVDHGLRSNSADEAAMVGQWCAAHDVPHAVLCPQTPITGSLQASARAARYALLEGWRQNAALDWIVTAHHADDQAETLLMRLNRGSGIGGLAGVRERNGCVIRPLLGWRRAELAGIVTQLGLPFVVDPSNSDPRFDRAALRLQLAQADWIDPAALARSAAALAEGEEALVWMASQIGQRHIFPTEEGVGLLLDKTDLPREILRRLLLQMLHIFAPESDPPRGSSIDQALVQLLQGNKAMIGNILISGGEQWRMRAAPPRRTV